MMKTSNPSSGRLLFDAPERPGNLFVANVDGASRGNPGPASYGVIVRGPDGAVRFEVGKYIGRVTNNVAEYYALITALDYAASQGIDRLLIRSDSELLVRQMQGRYKVNSPDLRPLHERARKLAHGFAYFAIARVPRERNREADELANLALDRTDSSGNRNTATGVTRNKAVETGALPGAAEDRYAESPVQERSGRDAARERRIRARYSAGVLHPLDVLDLDEGEIVHISIRRPRNPSSSNQTPNT